MSQKSRNVCFTLNNPELEEISDLLLNDRSTYIIFGFETGEQGTEHIQGYIEWKDVMRMNEMKNVIKRAHFEVRRGSQDQAIEYCKKDGDWYEFGEKKAQGKRNDLLEIKELLDAGGTLEDVADQHFGSYIRYKFDKYVEIKKKFNWGECDVYMCRNEDPDVVYGIGEKFSSVCYLDYGDYLSNYEGEEALVYIRGGVQPSYIDRFLRNIPIGVKYGYENRKVLPRAVFIFDEHLSKEYSQMDNINFIKK